ncbi:MAG TPA: DUF2304 family protein [Ilumatobacteraceae bacterium]|nr:DUF2304 family protein [Ilumatobacteraceae bacterium]
MSTAAKQALVLAGGGLLLAIVILRLARRRLLTTRYAFGWLGVGVLVVAAAAALPFVGRLGRIANITPTAVLLLMSSAVLLAISIQLSISVSLLQERLRATAEAHALLARRVEDLEAELAATAVAAAAVHVPMTSGVDER